MNAITIQGMTKSFHGTKALDGVSLSVARGTVLGLLGPNGAGKTTLINCVTTLLRPDSGTAVVAGHDVLTDPAAVRANVAVTGQFAALDEQLTASENLILFGRLLGLDKPAARARAEELLAHFELAEVAKMPAAYLSGGLRRRLDIAVSLIVPRPVLVLDEPTTGLDPRSRQVMWDTVRGLAQSGMSVLLTTQYLEEADELADEIVVIDRGAVVAHGAPHELKRQVGDLVLVATVADTGARSELVKQIVGSYQEGESIYVNVASMSDVSRIAHCFELHGVSSADFEVRRPSLNDVFFALTGSAEPRQESA